jgi:hypothetical protein
VSPWRKDFTGIRISPTKWRWGAEESRAYVTMHNEMSKTLAQVIGRLRPYYSEVVAWVAPGLTHRSFILDAAQRSANGVAASRRAGGESLPLRGANDLLPPGDRIECLPTPRSSASGRKRTWPSGSAALSPPLADTIREAGEMPRRWRCLNC